MSEEADIKKAVRYDVKETFRQVARDVTVKLYRVTYRIGDSSPRNFFLTEEEYASTNIEQAIRDNEAKQVKIDSGEFEL